jgi:hypothetical protein
MGRAEEPFCLSLDFFYLCVARFLHIAVAQGRRALAYVLASKMATVGMLDMKEHNGQVRIYILTPNSKWTPSPRDFCHTHTLVPRS